ncbi:ABC transporter ATP-binding protein [Marinimicrococcus flavescens]|uniref:ATP-binding cassette domain-containing protein n=1 Tax=Marinimicrococcus flavescens TaxID=3031815 RepID=A0AAP4D5K0_9PROT|nr:ATP-binding cassette domain-containing protein [Marinimicrococcus flavescens]
MAALTVDIRGKRFPAVAGAPAKEALGRVAFNVAEGETVALIGPSGCGKTTLLNLAAGLDGQAEGTVCRPAAGRLAYVFQEPRLLPWRTVEDNLRLVLADPSDPQERIGGLLAEVGLLQARHVFASRLSLGMARRVALARGFIVEPGLVLLDEPFASLDAPTARRLRLLLLRLLALHRTAALFVTHDLDEAIMLAHRLVFLSATPGRLVRELRIDLEPAERHDPAAVARKRLEVMGLPEVAGLLELDVEEPGP